MNTMNLFSENYANESYVIQQSEQLSVLNDDSAFESQHEDAATSNMEQIIRNVNDPNYEMNLNLVRFKQDCDISSSPMNSWITLSKIIMDSPTYYQFN